MSEGRKTQIVLIDERKLEILIQPKLYAGELFDLVASHFNLKEKEYFGLAFKDETDHFHWLQLDRKVLEHEFPKRSTDKEPLLLFFSVRFFIESIGYLRDSSTIELFFLQAKHSIYKGSLECDSETVFELAANILQSTLGDYTDDTTVRKHLKKLPVFPTTTLKDHPSLSYCEDKVIDYYKKLSGTPRGSGIVNYMTIVESLPTYGIHYYEVKDKNHIPWWLGLSYKGISLYDYSDKRTPRKVFAWKQLENLYFRDKKFSIEVHDPKRVVHTLSSFNLYEDAIHESRHESDDLSDAISDPTTQVSVSRRTFGPGNVNVHAWFASTPQLTKCIWSMAVSQHQFYLDRKQSKSQLPSVRSMSEIAADLCISSTSLPSSGNISRSNSAASLGQLSLHNSKTELTQEDLDNAKALQKEMYSALKGKKEALEELLKKKNEKLRELCIKEAELTGELPCEMPLIPGEPKPQIRRRVGTAFTLSPDILLMKQQAREEEDIISKLELEYELQKKIAEAALKLAQDKTVAKSVRKKRKQSYQKIKLQLKEIEKKLNDCRINKGKTPLHKNYNSADDLSEDSREFLDSDNEFFSPVNSPHVPRQNQSRSVSANNISGGHYKPINSNKVEVVDMAVRPSPPSSHGSSHHSTGSQQHYMSRGSTPSPGPHRHAQAYTTPAYTPRTPFRNQSYPNFHSAPYQQQAASQNNYSTNSNYHQPQHPSDRDYDNSYNPRSAPHSKHSATNTAQSHQENIQNVYNLNLSRTSHYESSSGDEFRSPTSSSGYASATYNNQNSEYYDSFPTDHGQFHQQQHYSHFTQGSQQRGIPRTNSFESTTSSSRGGGDGYRGYNQGAYQYGSLDRTTGLPYRQDDELSEMSIPDLLPTKFGSKRESHSDKHDSPYYVGGGSAQGYDYNMQGRTNTRHQQLDGRNPNSQVHSSNIQQNYSVNSNEDTTYMPQQNTSGSYSSLASNNSSYYYDNQGHHSQKQQQYNVANEDVGNVRQQAPPSTPQFESPPPAFIRQEVPPLYHTPSQPPQSHNYYTPQNSSSSHHLPNNRPVTVAKYSKYVEVSKPFEMADVYKYSEKIRKVTKPVDPCDSGQVSPAHSSSVCSGSSSNHRLNSPYMSRALIVNTTVTRSRSASPNTVQNNNPSPYMQQQQQPMNQPSDHVASSSISSSSSRGYYASNEQHGSEHCSYQSPQYVTSIEGHHGNTHRSINDTTANQSFGSFHNDSVSRAFSQEMLAWYEDQDGSQEECNIQHAPIQNTESSTLV